MPVFVMVMFETLPEVTELSFTPYSANSPPPQSLLPSISICRLLMFTLVAADALRTAVAKFWILPCRTMTLLCPLTSTPT